MTQVTLGNQQVTLRPLTTGEFLELLYMASDVLHDALMIWAGSGDDYSFAASLISKLGKDEATRIICLLLGVEPEWLEENTTPEEAYRALEIAVRMNNWSDMLQTMAILDTIKVEEILELWQTAKVLLKG